MPYVIVSTVALLSNLYKNAPLIVGDKDSDPELMRFLGARITTNYPACGSPPMYVMHAPPRTVFDNLEKRGYCLMSAQTIQEHSVWILARPRVPDDDKVEIARGGPNDKSIQAFEEDDTYKVGPTSIDAPSSSRRNDPSRGKSPNRSQRVKVEVVAPQDIVKLKQLETDNENVYVTSKGDGNADWLGNEKVHMRVQVSNSDVSIQNVPEVSTKSTGVLETKQPSTSSKYSVSMLKEPPMAKVEQIKQSESKETIKQLEPYITISSGTQVNLSSSTLVFVDGWENCAKKEGESGVSLHYCAEEAKKKFDAGKPLMIDSFTQNISGTMGNVGGVILPKVSLQKVSQKCKNSAERTQDKEKIKDLNVKETVNVGSQERYSSISILGNPVFNLSDPKNLACLTQDNCCCEDGLE